MYIDIHASKIFIYIIENKGGRRQCMAAHMCTCVVGQGQVETGRSHDSRNSRSRQDDKFLKMEAFRGLGFCFCFFLNDSARRGGACL